MVQRLQTPGSIRSLAKALERHGGRAFLVGGCVRDHLMGLPVADWDVEVFGVSADTLRDVLVRHGHVNEVGRAFGVFKFSPRGKRSEAVSIDVSIPRRDSQVGPGHRGIAVEGDPDMSIEEAARRRDLTVNAILMDVLTGDYHDPFGGMSDLEQRVLRAVDTETFLEDPLRALRVVQFVARFQFEAGPELIALCRAARLHELPAERIQGEWIKLLLKGVKPSMGLQMARDAKILERVFPEAFASDSLSMDRGLDSLVASERPWLSGDAHRLAAMLSVWLYDATSKDIEATMDRLWLHKWQGYPVRERVLQTVTHRGLPLESDSDLRWAATKLELRLAFVVRRSLLGECVDGPRARARALGIEEQPLAPILKGRHLKHLGIEPGPAMGRILQHVYARQLDGFVSDLESAKRCAVDAVNAGSAE